MPDLSNIPGKGRRERDMLLLQSAEVTGSCVPG